MKVFISWSGPLSKSCAEILRDWIKCSLQASEPWISTKDIDKGSLWFNEIGDQLQDTTVGIVCLTSDNKDKPWILFESGALAKGLSTSRVCTLLINLKPSQLDNPLAQFNHTLPDRDGMKGLLETINRELGESALDEKILDQVFEAYWPTFEERFSAAMEESKESPGVVKPTRTSDDILEEILYTTRRLDRRVRELESSRGSGSEVQNYMSKTEATDLIESLIADGMEPEHVISIMEGKAPRSFVRRFAKRLWDEKQSIDSEPEDD